MAFAELPSLSERHSGQLCTMSPMLSLLPPTLLRGAGNKYPKGTNVVVVKVGDAYKYDVLAGFVDLSSYVERKQGGGAVERTSLRALGISWDVGL